jgi:hypothetical protein
MFTGQRVLGTCLALRSPGLCKNAVVFSPTVGNMECCAFNRGQISRFLVATPTCPHHRQDHCSTKMSPSNYPCIFPKNILDGLAANIPARIESPFTKGPMGLSKDYDHQKWVKLYKMAILGLERAKLPDRIEDTRVEMAARIVKLRDVPGLHTEEISAIDRAHRILLVLESEGDWLVTEQKRRAIEEALRQVRSIAPKIQKLNRS